MRGITIDDNTPWSERCILWRLYPAPDAEDIASGGVKGSAGTLRHRPFLIGGAGHIPDDRLEYGVVEGSERPVRDAR